LLLPCGSDTVSNKDTDEWAMLLAHHLELSSISEVEAGTGCLLPLGGPACLVEMNYCGVSHKSIW
jgi:hypothetical protein